MNNSIIDIESVTRDLRAQEEQRVNQKIATVRTLASAADRALQLREELETAESEWAATYKAALQAGFDERELMPALRPPAGAKPKAASRRPRSTPVARTSETPSSDAPAAGND